MADQLATPADLATLLGLGSDIDTARAALLVECATAVVQGAAGQRIVQVIDDVADLTGTAGPWLDLPQIPVTAVSAVALDGAALTAGAAGSGGTTYRLRGNRLWRGDGWQTYCGEPSSVTVTYTHGYAAGAQELQLARSAVLGLIRDTYDNAAGLKSERLDDWAATYAEMSAHMDGTPYLRKALRRAYGRRGGLVRLGG